MSARPTIRRRHGLKLLVAIAALGQLAAAWAGEHTSEDPPETVSPFSPPAPKNQAPEEARAKSWGCVSCHTATDRPTMHASPAVVLGCTDCHGGNATVTLPPDTPRDSAAYIELIRSAHVMPRDPQAWGWPSSRLPKRTYTLLNGESPEFIRFINPGDLRISREACGACHMEIIETVERSLMSTTAMFWGGAAYNNGIVDRKRYVLGEAYTRDGLPAKLEGPPEDDSRDALRRGILPFLMPLPRWEVAAPADNFRVFERGGRNVRSQFPEIGLPNPIEEPGKPDIRQSNRGLATGARISVPVLNLHKTRLNDPTLWFLGTADNPGDFRSSGCTACHTPYANDRDPLHSGPLAQYGNMGETATADPLIPRNEPGHPIRHEFTRAIPTSQCIVCHMHQPNMFVNSYLGYTMWDYESDAPAMWPKAQRYPTSAEIHAALEANPEGAVARGNWSDIDFLRNVSELNPGLTDTQFADYHGHGWNFRAVYKRARDGTLLDAAGRPVSDDQPAEKKFKDAVHLRDIHAEKGMQCTDCHFSQDAHGDGHLRAEVAAAIEIRCQDCHGTVDSLATLRTSGPAAPPGGTDLSVLRNADGQLRFAWEDGQLFQRSVVQPEVRWRVKQVRNSVTRGDHDYNPKAARAKTMVRGQSQKWDASAPAKDRAHRDDEIACFSCHSSWMTSCAGCHLPIEANRKTTRHHYEGGETRNYATYNPQVARDDMFILGRHGEVKNGIVAPVRSSSALVLSSTDINRNRIYVQQGPVSAAGFSAQAFAPHFPHTVRKTETKSCDDCHLSAAGDNNAIMAQLLGLGTSFVNFVGLNAWVGTSGGIAAIQVTEWEEPQAVIGSYLHGIAYPDFFAEHQARERKLQGLAPFTGRSEHEAGDVRCLQLRGEYLYSAEGDRGFRAYDVASIGNKAFSERFITAPFSPLGQDTHLASTDATCVALPTNQPIRPERNHFPGDSEEEKEKESRARNENLEQLMHPIYRYAAVTDAKEGLILTDVTTLGDFEPRNNFLRRDVVWNPHGLLNGATYATFAGHVLYVAAEVGVVVVDLDDPQSPRHLATIPMDGARAMMVQFRYLFALDATGLRVIDVTEPSAPRTIEEARVSIADAHRVFVARTYAYVAAGREGLLIVDVTRPEKPCVLERVGPESGVSDARDVVVASTNASLFAYVADGAAGLKLLQLTSPKSQKKFYGFSPEPRPELIAWAPTDGAALSLSRGLERDRAVDETGHQVAVFGRVGSRPLRLEEMKQFFLDDSGSPWFVPSEQPGARCGE